MSKAEQFLALGWSLCISVVVGAILWFTLSSIQAQKPKIWLKWRVMFIGICVSFWLAFSYIWLIYPVFNLSGVCLPPASKLQTDYSGDPLSFRCDLMPF